MLRRLARLRPGTAPAAVRTLATAVAPPKRTPLYELHAEHFAKVVTFAGYDMPLLYNGSSSANVAGGAVQEHHHVRTAAGLFDVGHMVQSTFVGPGALGFLLKMLPASLEALAVDKLGDKHKYKSSLSVLLNEEGGIIDDCMITRWGPESFYLVTNAGRAERDMAWLTMHAHEWNASNEDQVQMDILHGWGLVALQGPASAAALAKLLPPSFPLSSLHFGQSTFAPLSEGSASFHIARGGYTGEDGFEISFPPHLALDMSRKLLDLEGVKLAGLAARDSLRLEAGLCLYGHDLDETIGVGEAGLGWVVGKDRKGTSPAFTGSSRSLAASTLSRRRIGLTVEPGPPAREGAFIYTPDGQTKIGIVTSGLPSPTTKLNISMGYVETHEGRHKKGSECCVEVRGRMRKATVVGMPWITPGYYRG